MHPELENLMNMALADGEVTEKEREIIFRKADKLGEDRDEVEMILDGKIATMKKEQVVVQPQIPKSNKEGDLKKCPSCGASVQSFKTKCTECDHEFRNIEANSSINSLFQILQNIYQEERNKPKVKGLNGFFASSPFVVERAIANKQAMTISSFPVPNTKEDIFEFLTLAFPEAKKKMEFVFGETPEKQLKKAWLAKCQQVIMKGRLAMKDDKSALEVVNNYAKQLGIK